MTATKPLAHLPAPALAVLAILAALSALFGCATTRETTQQQPLLESNHRVLRPRFAGAW